MVGSNTGSNNLELVYARIVLYFFFPGIWKHNHSSSFFYLIANPFSQLLLVYVSC